MWYRTRTKKDSATLTMPVSVRTKGGRLADMKVTSCMEEDSQGHSSQDVVQCVRSFGSAAASIRGYPHMTSQRLVMPRIQLSVIVPPSKLFETEPPVWKGENSSPCHGSIVEREAKPGATPAPPETRWKLIWAYRIPRNQLQILGSAPRFCQRPVP